MQFIKMVPPSPPPGAWHVKKSLCSNFWWWPIVPHDRTLFTFFHTSKYIPFFVCIRISYIMYTRVVFRILEIFLSIYIPFMLWSFALEQSNKTTTPTHPELEVLSSLNNDCCISLEAHISTSKKRRRRRGGEHHHHDDKDDCEYTKREALFTIFPFFCNIYEVSCRCAITNMTGV